MAISEETIRELAQQLGESLAAKGMRLAAAESCTGGWLAKVITDIPGSSDWFEASIVCYSNDSKNSLLGVSPKTIKEFGAVSSNTVLEMTEGLFDHTQADVGISISGIAGPGGGTADKPVGTVWLCWGQRGKSAYSHEFHFEGDRESVRLQAMKASLEALLELLVCS